MHDIKAIRDDPDAFDRAWASRGLEPRTAAILELDRSLRAARVLLQAAQARRHEVSKLIGAAKAKRDEARASELMAEVETLKRDLARFGEAEREAEEGLAALLAQLPNIPAHDVPTGRDEQGNQEVEPRSESRKQKQVVGDWPNAKLRYFAFSPKDHAALGEALGLMDFEAAARMSGARFVVLKGELARLERAIGQFMLDMQTVEHGYTEVNPPLLVRDEAAFGTGQLPKFRNDLFFASSFLKGEAEALLQREGIFDPSLVSSDFIASDRKFFLRYDEMRDRVEIELEDREIVEASDLYLTLDRDYISPRRWLIPTAEVSLTNLVREQITPEDELPMRVTALTPCFRSEAGASGRDTRGMIRQHQFYKCELVSITTPEQSEDEHERMTACAEAVLKRLELPYRTMLLCTGDMGFTAKKTYDLEVWLPSEGRYREISSCSNCGDFQARRMDARCRKPGEKGTRFVHTLNGSGLAVGRTLVAVLENYQDEGGRIAVPQALHPYMRGATHIGGAS